nr:ATP synthase F0 subunit 6 [Scatoglyphus polytrematus]
MMMTNLFSIFDPCLSLFSLSFLMIGVILFWFPSIYWLNCIFSCFFYFFLAMVKGEVDCAKHDPAKGVYLFIMTIFLVVFSYNFLAMFPFIFSLTSHLFVTLPISYCFWLGVIFFSLVSGFKSFLSHLVPLGTPLALMSFMVMVELLSNLIRPLALTLRLTANMMAGHLLMSLIGGGLVGSSVGVLMLGSVLQSLLVFMELGVSLIQAYVFSTLLLLYLSEGKF